MRESPSSFSIVLSDDPLTAAGLMSNFLVVSEVFEPVRLARFNRPDHFAVLHGHGKSTIHFGFLNPVDKVSELLVLHLPSIFHDFIRVPEFA